MCLRQLVFVCLSLFSCVNCQARSPFPGPKTDYLGVASYSVPILEQTATVLAPDQPAAGQPWVLTASLYKLDSVPVAYMARTQIELVKRGFHVVALDIGNTFGAPDAIAKWDAVYQQMTVTYGLSKKVALMGLSRQGLSIARWAAKHPGSAACLYMDKAVCDFKSWPGGKLSIGRGSPENWKSLLEHYHFGSESEALAYRENPVDLAEQLVADQVPIIYLAGAQDEVVPYAENGARMEQVYRKLGGVFRLILRTDEGHHPHGLADPTPVVEFIQLHCAGGAADQPKLKLGAPLDYQIIQRSTAKQARVPVQGEFEHTDRSPSRLEARWIDQERSSEWQELNVKRNGSAFSGVIDMPAGGWYRLELRALADGKAVATALVEHVGVGEVFIVAGQSNSANHGEVQQKTKTNRVAAFDGQRWQLANDPQPGASGKGGSFIPPLGDELIQRLDVPIGFIACGIGATSVREWLPKGTAFPNPPTIESRVERQADGQWVSKGEAFAMLVRRMQQMGPQGFRAVLWHQGESDANQKDTTRTLAGNLYTEYLTKVIADSRREIGWEAPWFVAQVSYHVPGDEASPDIRDAQAALWKASIALEGPDSDALKGPLRERNGQGVHFSGAGLVEHAHRWADKITPWLEKQLRAAP